MSTEIFKDYYAFEAREDKSVNGVSPLFAAIYDGFERDNLTNRGCWNCRVCRHCVDCIECGFCDNCEGLVEEYDAKNVKGGEINMYRKL